MPMACNSLVDKLDALGWPLSLKQTLSTTPCTQERPKQDSRAAQATSPNAESLQPRSPRASVLTTRPEQEEEPFSQSSQDGAGLVCELGCGERRGVSRPRTGARTQDQNPRTRPAPLG